MSLLGYRFGAIPRIDDLNLHMSSEVLATWVRIGTHVSPVK
jgi:hypothetical protein